MAQRKKNGWMSRFLSSFLRNFSMKMNAFFIKWVADALFSLGEKVVVTLDAFLPLYIGYYDDIVESEITLAQVKASDTVLHVGCGPVPSTSVLFAQKTKASVVGIDKQHRAVDDAWSCIQQLRLEKRVRVECANALDFPLEGFDVIIVSQGVEPRYDILERISSVMNKGVRVMFRTVSSVEGGLSEEDQVLRRFFKVVDIVSYEKHGLLISVLLLKK